VRETLGGAGIVIEPDIALAAEALHEVVGGAGTRAGLAAAARRRLAELDPALVADRLRAALTPLLEAA
jgi:glycosyltransferase involved in cell wall biosynthesis